MTALTPERQLLINRVEDYCFRDGLLPEVGVTNENLEECIEIMEKETQEREERYARQ